MTPAPTRPLSLRVLFVAVCVVHVVVLYWPARPPAPESFLDVPHLDKLVHVVLFAMVAATGRWVGLAATPLTVVLVGHAGLSELIQVWLPAVRDADLWDILADLVGVGVGLAVARRGRVQPVNTPS